MHSLIERLEVELLDRTIISAMQDFRLAYQKDPTYRYPEKATLRGYIALPGNGSDDIPERLAKWPAGKQGEIKWGGREYLVLREDVGGGARLYMALDIEEMEQLEEELVGHAWFLIIGSLFGAALVGLWLSRVITRPVSRLAALVTELDPSNRGVKLADRFVDPEVGVIATAFDRYLENLDRFIEREQSFTDDASHELRTPLTVVISAAELLREDKGTTPLGRERVERIMRGAAQMQKLVEALLFLAREDGGIGLEPCELGGILEEAVSTHRELVNDQAVSLGYDIKVPQSVVAPRAMVQCIVNNLLGNAIQHTSQGRIDLWLQEGRIVVQDTGSGISGEDLAHIFERRYRGAQSRGLGLGLYLVKRICDRLGWRIEATNAPGAGARFDLYFSPAN